MFVMLVTIFVAVSNFGLMYTVPIFFRAIDGTSASTAGSHLLPTSVGNVIGGFAAGFYIHKTGKYRKAAILIGLLPIIGAVLLSFLRTDSSPLHKWLDVGLVGIGFNAILNASFVALMASVPHSDVPAVTGVMWLFRTTVRLFLSVSFFLVS
jgi:predicted MFS family arabinose efflux permease